MLRPPIPVPPARAALATAGLIVAATWSPMAAGDPCPLATVQLDYRNGSFEIAATFYDSTDAGTHVTFDRIGAALAMEVASAGRHQSEVRVADLFDVIGVAPGAVVHATLEYRVAGWASQSCGGSGCGLELAGSVTVSGTSAEAELIFAGPGIRTEPLDATLRIPVAFTAGSAVTAEFRLSFANGPGDGPSAAAEGAWSFTGLPPGVQVVACDGATPARASTWGALKLRYR